MPRVCLIDDDIFVRDALALGLTDAGYDIVVAPGAAAGLDVLSRQPIDAVITDLNMPGTHGGDLIAEARARWPNLPIIAISGAAEVEGRRTEDFARELGADAALAKPFRARQLAELLSRVLTERAGPSP